LSDAKDAIKRQLFASREADKKFRKYNCLKVRLHYRLEQSAEDNRCLQIGLFTSRV
jgi:hypothetical protein